MIPRPALLESDILSEVIKAVDQNVVTHATAYAKAYGALTFTSASLFEILYGLQRKTAKTKIERAEAVFTENVQIVPQEGDYRLTAEISAALDRQGTPIGFIDALIAACALRRSYVVVTGNTRHYEFIQRAGYAVEIENWRQHEIP